MLPEENSILLGVPANGLSAALLFPYTLGCANKDLDRSLGPLGKFIEYCRIVVVLRVIPLTVSYLIFILATICSTATTS